MNGIGKYSKFIVALLGLATTVLTAYQGSAAWVAPAISALSALGVVLVPNQQPPAT